MYKYRVYYNELLVGVILKSSDFFVAVKKAPEYRGVFLVAHSERGAT